jgi:hypothetical protein
MQHCSLNERSRAHKYRARSHGDGVKSWLPVSKAYNLVDIDFQALAHISRPEAVVFMAPK